MLIDIEPMRVLNLLVAKDGMNLKRYRINFFLRNQWLKGWYLDCWRREWNSSKEVHDIEVFLERWDDRGFGYVFHLGHRNLGFLNHASFKLFESHCICSWGLLVDLSC